jgi:hypothetical protein
MTDQPSTGAEARHQVANLLNTYVDIADRKDVEQVVAILGRARVRFPTGGSAGPEEARSFFEGLWASPVRHRHDVSNLVVVPGATPQTWTARAHYTRWIFDPAPALHTLGEYELVVTERPWAIAELRVTRTWTMP